MTITTQNIELQNTAYYCQWGSTMCLAKFFKLVKVGTKFYGISIPAKEYHISATSERAEPDLATVNPLKADHEIFPTKFDKDGDMLVQISQSTKKWYGVRKYTDPVYINTYD